MTRLLSAETATRMASPAEIQRRDPHSPEAIRARRSGDLRLVPVAAAVWAATLAQLHWRGWGVVAALGLVGVVLGALYLGVQWRDRRDVLYLHHDRRARLLAALSPVLAAIAAATALAGILATVMAGIDHDLARAGGNREVTAVVSEASKVGRDGAVRVTATLEHLHQIRVPMGILRPTTQLRVPKQVAGEMEASLRPGDRVRAEVVRMSGDRLRVIPVEYRVRRIIAVDQRVPDPLRARLRVPDLLGARQRVRDVMQQAVAPSRGEPGSALQHARGLVPGMLIGDTSTQSAEVTANFRATGLMHLTAVSGSNVAIIVGAVMGAAAACRLGRRAVVAVAFIGLGGFVVIVGVEPSVLRAAVMGVVGLVAVITGRWKDSTAALTAAITAAIIISPDLAASYGLALSAAATAGIIWLHPRLSRAVLRRYAALTRRRWGRTPIHGEVLVARAVALSVAADVATIPLLIAMTGTVPLTSVAANVAVSWAVPLVTITGMVALLGACVLAGVAALLPALAGLSTALAGVFFLPVILCASAIVVVARTFAAAPQLLVPSTLSWIGGVLLLGGAGMTALVVPKQRRRLILVCLIVWSLVLTSGVTMQMRQLGLGLEPPIRLIRAEATAGPITPRDRTQRWPEPGWTPPSLSPSDFETAQVIVVATEADIPAALTRASVATPPTQASTQATVLTQPAPSTPETTPHLILVVTACGSPTVRPTYAPDTARRRAWPVVYPCRDGPIPGPAQAPGPIPPAP